ncbi:DNA damage-inducible protein D [Acetobacter aceti]|nr:DNA damage-inducible protein D [Acetobacter aceti]
MTESEIDEMVAAFEKASHRSNDGSEYWFARDLQGLLRYGSWSSFRKVLAHAAEDCRKSDQPIENHFEGIVSEVATSATKRSVPDIRLSRYACHLVAKNSDIRKKGVAFAQGYFIVQVGAPHGTDVTHNVLSAEEDDRRILIRNLVKKHNRQLVNAAKGAGVINRDDLALFESNGYSGLYGNRTVAEIRQIRGLPQNANLLDRMGSAELAANFFRVTQTEEKLRREDLNGKRKAYQAHYEVGRQVREAMLKISGIPPEKLPLASPIRSAAKRKARKTDGTTDQTEDESPQEIDLKADLWKYALLVMATRDDGFITTTELIAELPKYIAIPDEHGDVLRSRRDSKFSQIVRNLKSHRKSHTNFIFCGYAENIPGGFLITERGREFVQSYFLEYE